MEVFVTIFVLTLVIAYIIKQMREQNAARREPQPDDVAVEENRPAGSLRAAHEELFALAESLEEFAQVSAYPSDLLERPSRTAGIRKFFSGGGSILRFRR
jgi:hypothetical protein